MEKDRSFYGIPFKIPLKPFSFAILCLGIALNLIGKYITINYWCAEYPDGSTYPMYLWLDSIGTVFSAAALGPVAGAIVGLAGNLINMIQDVTAFFYAFVSVAIGGFVGCLYPRTKITLNTLSFMALLTIFVVILLCGPLNLLFYNGYPGTFLGDAVFDRLNDFGLPKVLGALLAEMFVDVPDKLISVLMGTGLFVVYKKIA